MYITNNITNLVCQGKADYYIAPLIILIYKSEELINSIKKYK